MTSQLNLPAGGAAGLLVGATPPEQPHGTLVTSNMRDNTAGGTAVDKLIFGMAPTGTWSDGVAYSSVEHGR